MHPARPAALPARRHPPLRPPPRGHARRPQADERAEGRAPLRRRPEAGGRAARPRPARPARHAQPGGREMIGADRENHPATMIRAAAERRRLNGEDGSGERPPWGPSAPDDDGETASAADALTIAMDRLPRELAEVIEADPKLADSWMNGTKLTKGDKTSPKALEYSLLHYLAWRDHGDELIEAAVRHY